MFFYSEKSPAIFRWAMDPKKIRPVVTKHRVHLKESFQKFWSVFFFFNWVLFSIWFNLKLESTGNYESNFLFVLNTSRRMCVDSVDREWPFTSLPRKSCPFARTHGPFSREHYPLHILSIAASLQKKNCDGTMKASSVLIFPLCLKNSKYRFRQLFEHKNYWRQG